MLSYTGKKRKLNYFTTAKMLPLLYSIPFCPLSCYAHNKWNRNDDINKFLESLNNICSDHLHIFYCHAKRHFWKIGQRLFTHNSQVTTRAFFPSFPMVKKCFKLCATKHVVMGKAESNNYAFECFLTGQIVVKASSTSGSWSPFSYHSVPAGLQSSFCCSYRTPCA